MGSHSTTGTLLRAAGVVFAMASLPAVACSEVEGTTAWPQGRGVPRSVRPLVFNVRGRVERLLLLDVGPVSEPVTAMQLDEKPPKDFKPKPDSSGTPVAVDVRVLVQTRWVAIVEIVPWAGRPLPARRKFQIIDPEIRPGDGSGPSAVLGQFETGDAFEEQRPGLDRLVLQPRRSNPQEGIACQCGLGLFSFDLDPASAAPHAFAIWLYSESPGSPPSALALSRMSGTPPLPESLTIERSTGISTGQDLALPPGERSLVLRERRMNGSYGPAFRFRISVPHRPKTGGCEGA